MSAEHSSAPGTPPGPPPEELVCIRCGQPCTPDGSQHADRSRPPACPGPPVPRTRTQWDTFLRAEADARARILRALQILRGPQQSGPRAPAGAETEYFTWLQWRWNITEALHRYGAKPAQLVDIASARQFLHAGLVRINPDRLNKADITRPILIAPTPDVPNHVIIIDGWHRVARALTRGFTDLPAIFLTADESESVLTRRPSARPNPWFTAAAADTNVPDAQESHVEHGQDQAGHPSGEPRKEQDS